jgi:WD40 repeat protein
MSKYAIGKHSKAISDRSGMEFPYKEMVKEWNGSFVHVSEFEPKQPQLEPKPIGGDGVALLNVRPDRTEFPTPDFLPNNPFSITNGTKKMTVSFPDYSTEEQGGELNYVRFQGVKTPVGARSIEQIELSSTLNANISSTATSITLSAGDGSFYLPSNSFVVIEKVNSETGRYENEVVSYETATIHIATGIVTLNNCVRGTAAPFRGETFSNTTASSHLAGAKVFGCRLASIDPDTVVTGAQPATIQQYNRFTITFDSNSTSTATGGGLQCTVGPLNDRS